MGERQTREVPEDPYTVGARDPGSTRPQGSGRRERRGEPVTFTAKSMTLLTATSARSSAIFLPRRPAGSELTFCFPDRSPRPPALLCACAPRRQSANRCGARLPAPTEDQSGGREAESPADAGQWEAAPEEGGGTRRRRDRSFGKGAWPGTGGKVLQGRDASQTFFPRSLRGSVPSPRSPPLTLLLESGESGSACVSEL